MSCQTFFGKPFHIQNRRSADIGLFEENPNEGGGSNMDVDGVSGLVSRWLPVEVSIKSWTDVHGPLNK